MTRDYNKLNQLPTLEFYKLTREAEAHAKRQHVQTLVDDKDLQALAKKYVTGDIASRAFEMELEKKYAKEKEDADKDPEAYLKKVKAAPKEQRLSLGLHLLVADEKDVKKLDDLQQVVVDAERAMHKIMHATLEERGLKELNERLDIIGRYQKEYLHPMLDKARQQNEPKKPEPKSPSR